LPGNGAAAAHQNLVANLLDDIYANCHSCHPDDYQARAERFAAELGVTPGSSPTPMPVPVGLVVGHPVVILPPPCRTRQLLSLVSGIRRPGLHHLIPDRPHLDLYSSQDVRLSRRTIHKKGMADHISQIKTQEIMYDNCFKAQDCRHQR
jgi:hypothetical protein